MRYPAFRIDRADVHAVALFFDLDLNLLQKFLCVAGVRILHLKGGGNLDIAPALAMDGHFTETVVEAHALIAAERQRFLKVALDLVLHRGLRNGWHGQTGQGQRHRRYRDNSPERGAARLIVGWVSHCFASKPLQAFPAFPDTSRAAGGAGGRWRGVCPPAISDRRSRCQALAASRGSWPATAWKACPVADEPAYPACRSPAHKRPRLFPLRAPYGP